MIARQWHGRVPAEKASAYLALMRNVALPEYRATPGNRGAWCLMRADGDVVHFDMLTFWDDFAAIRRFAGDQPEVAKYYDFDAEYLLEKEPHVVHYEMHE
jgi:hypothetical protein